MRGHSGRWCKAANALMQQPLTAEDGMQPNKTTVQRGSKDQPQACEHMRMPTTTVTPYK
jgi:hypothetical protein